MKCVLPECVSNKFDETRYSCGLLSRYFSRRRLFEFIVNLSIIASKKPTNKRYSGTLVVTDLVRAFTRKLDGPMNVIFYYEMKWILNNLELNSVYSDKYIESEYNYHWLHLIPNMSGRYNMNDFSIHLYHPTYLCSSLFCLYCLSDNSSIHFNTRKFSKRKIRLKK